MSGPLPFKTPKGPTEADRRKLRGTLWQCPYCRQGYPLADCGPAGLVPVQLTLVKGYHPIGNITGPDGKPAQTEVQKLTRSSVFREVPVLVPHILLCIPAMRARGINPTIYAGVLIEPPGLVPPGTPTNDSERKGDNDDDDEIQ